MKAKINIAFLWLEKLKSFDSQTVVPFQMLESLKKFLDTGFIS